MVFEYTISQLIKYRDQIVLEKKEEEEEKSSTEISEVVSTRRTRRSTVKQRTPSVSTLRSTSTTSKRPPSRITRTSSPPRQYGTTQIINSQKVVKKKETESSTSHNLNSISSSPVKENEPPMNFATTLAKRASLIQQLSTIKEEKKESRLPVFPEPLQTKCHWDILLEEMKWMATDFFEERRWKIAAASRIANAALGRKHQDQIEEEMSKRQIARAIAMKISAFWRSMERITARNRLRFATTSASSRTGAESSSEKVSIATRGRAAFDQSHSNTSADGGNVSSNGGTKVESNEGPSATAESSSSSTMMAIDSPVVKASTENPLGAPSQLKLSPSSSEEITKLRLELETTVIPKIEKMQLDFNHEDTSLYSNQMDCLLPHSLLEYQSHALRWMLTMNEKDVNFFFCDQFGLEKAKTVCAFLKCATMGENATASAAPKGPSLLIAPDHLVHKWVYWMYFWFPSSSSKVRIQVYGGSRFDRRKQRRQWLEDEKDFVHFVICRETDLLAESQIFTEQQWTHLIVHAPGENVCQDVQSSKELQRLSTSMLKGLRQSILETWRIILKLKSCARRILVANEFPHWEESQSLYLQFLVATSLPLKSCIESSLQFKVLKLLHLRRCRNDVESQFYKVDEQSVSCFLTENQANSYRDVVLNPGLMGALESGGISAWLTLMLKLRSICQGVEILGKMDKMSHCDIRGMEMYSGKLKILRSILKQKVKTGESTVDKKAPRRFVIYSQNGDVLQMLEYFISLLHMSTVRITGDVMAQHRGLAHFASHPLVQVALVSTRCAAASVSSSCSMLPECSQALRVYGASSVIVFDSDWDPIIDAKIRAVWQHMAVTEPVSVYRLHCDGTIESAMLRSGSCLTDKLFGGVSPRNLIRGGAVSAGQSSPSSSSPIPVDNIPAERPQWWLNTSSKPLLTKAKDVSKGYNNTSAVSSTSHINHSSSVKMVEETALQHPLLGAPVQDLTENEHLLLSRTDELMPVEWFAVNIVACETAAENEESGSSTGASNTMEMDDEGEEESGSCVHDLFVEGLVLSPAMMAKRSEKNTDQLFYTSPLLNTKTSTDPESENQPPLVWTKEDQVLQIQAQLNQYRFEGSFEPEYTVYGPPDPQEQYDLIRRVHDESSALHLKTLYQVKAPPPVKMKKSEIKAALKAQQAAAAAAASTSSDGLLIKPIKVKLKRGRKAMLDKDKKSRKGLSAEEKLALKRQRRAAAAQASAAAQAAAMGDGLYSASDGLLGQPFGEDAIYLDESTFGIFDAELDLESPAPQRKAKSPIPSASKKMKQQQQSFLTPNDTQGKPGRKSNQAIVQESMRDTWTPVEDQRLLPLRDMVDSNWNLICFLINHSASSAFGSRRRSGRQCVERHGRLSRDQQPRPVTKSASPQSTPPPILAPEVEVKTEPSSAPAPPLPPASSSTGENETLVPPTVVVKEKNKEPYSFFHMPSGPVISFPAYADHLSLGTSMRLPPPNVARVKPLFTQWKESKLSIPLHTCAEQDKKPLVHCFGQIVLAMRGKKAPPPIPGTEAANRSNTSTMNHPHPSHAQAVAFASAKYPSASNAAGSLENNNNVRIMSPEEVIEHSKRMAMKESSHLVHTTSSSSSSSSKEVHATPSSSSTSATSINSSTLQAISASVGGVGNHNHPSNRPGGGNTTFVNQVSTSDCQSFCSFTSIDIS